MAMKNIRKMNKKYSLFALHLKIDAKYMLC